MMRPLFFQRPDGAFQPEMTTRTLTAKVIPTMGRAAFIEQPTSIRGAKFSYVQWKGVGENPHNAEIEEYAKANGGTVEFPLGKKGVSPLMLVSVDGRSMLRFLGGSYYEDLVAETKNQGKFSQFGLRMPEILKTIKFSRSFCEQQGLPMPNSDDPEDVGGQTFDEYLESHRSEIELSLYTKLFSSGEAHAGYTSLILGQNIRAFRNVWRAEDFERILDSRTETEDRTSAVQNVFDASAQILGEELGRELDTQEYVKEYAKILGEQTAILLANKLNHGSLADLKQNITLAGEVVDFDATTILDDTYLQDPTHYPDWVMVDGKPDQAHVQEWKDQQLDELYRQVYYMASHIQPLLEGIKLLQGESVVISKPFIVAFVEGLKQSISTDQLGALKKRIEKDETFGTVEGMYTGYGGSIDERRRKNFQGCENLFDELNKALLENS
ncbi:hypothetical protein HY626_01450 [Candidatus Uhrbacteria bacterium]|nr:hypothetical protein [Candidatus Uhrbacteria bacterium]